MTYRTFVVALALLLTTCSDPEPEEAKDVPMSPQLESLRQEPKFEPEGYYAGPDTPEDGPLLIALVNDAIDDVAAIPEPRDPNKVRDRLAKLVRDVDLFATEDRDRSYRYAIRIWRAAGFSEESGLFPVPDDEVLAHP